MVEWLRTATVSKLTWGAAVYGLALSVVGFLASGMGHGTYVPAAVFGAPLALIPGPIFIIAPLLWWPYVVYSVDVSKRPHLSLAMLLSHVVFVAVTLAFGPPFWFGEDSREYFSRVLRVTGPLIPFGVVVYGLGQIAIWSFVIDRFSAESPAE